MLYILVYDAAAMYCVCVCVCSSVVRGVNDWNSGNLLR